MFAVLIYVTWQPEMMCIKYKELDFQYAKAIMTTQLWKHRTTKKGIHFAETMGNEVSYEVIVWGSTLIFISTFWAVVVVISTHWLLVKSLGLHHHSAAAKSSKCAFTQQASSKVLEKSKQTVWSWHVSHNSGNISWLEIIMKCKNLSAGNRTNKVHPYCSTPFWIFGFFAL